MFNFIQLLKDLARIFKFLYAHISYNGKNRYQKFQCTYNHDNRNSVAKIHVFLRINRLT